MYVLNFYSPVFVDQLKRGRKTATIRLGDKSGKYRRGQLVWVTVGYSHEPREKVFTAVIDDVEVKRVRELSPRDIEHDNPEFRRVDDTVHFLGQIYGREVQHGRSRHRDPLLAGDREHPAPRAARQRAEPPPPARTRQSACNTGFGPPRGPDLALGLLECQRSAARPLRRTCLPGRGPRLLGKLSFQEVSA